MCFYPSDPAPVAAPSPVALSDQPAAKKKKDNQLNSADLSIGTKKYQSVTGLGKTADAPVNPDGPRTAM